ncbi:MAG: PLP-dependent transferase [Pseudomonadota bacterium]
MKPETVAIHQPGGRDRGALAEPICLSTTFDHGPANERPYGYEYIRDENPNVDALEARLAALEHGSQALAFGSGMAAATALLSGLERGSRVLFHSDTYFDVRDLAETRLPALGVAVGVADLTDAAAFERTLSDDTRMVWFETPSNPRLDIVDIGRVAAASQAAGASVVVDSTFATPALQCPLTLGADVVLHSLTKYMGGHSDVQGGALVLRDDPALYTALKRQRRLTGGVLAPFNAWLISRGLTTLHCRVRQQCETALGLAGRLAAHAAVATVHYPTLPGRAGSELAARQMTAGGAMLSIEIAGGRAAALRVAAALSLFVNATSLGGVESLVEHRASVEGPESLAPPGLLRLSIGLEHIDDLWADLAAALAQAAWPAQLPG